MEVISRSDAIQRQLSRYFTGEPCAKGHLTYRYTKNGGCSDCINPKFASLDIHHREEARRHVRALKSANELRRQGFFLHLENLERFTTTVLLMASSHDAAIERADVIARRGWVSGPDETQLRQFWIFPEDVSALREIERAMMQDRNPPVQHGAVVLEDAPDGSVRQVRKTPASSPLRQSAARLNGACAHIWETPPGPDTQHLKCSKCSLTNY
jgi:hypothetical protein